jgi:hypothetical protein
MGDGGSRARPAIEEGEFTEAVSLADHGQGRLGAGPGDATDPNSTLDNDVEGIASVAFAEDGGAGREAADAAAGCEEAHIFVWQAGQQRNVADIGVVGIGVVSGHFSLQSGDSHTPGA